MNEQSNNLVQKTNKSAVFGLVLGVVSILPYLPFLSVWFFSYEFYISQFGKLMNFVSDATPFIVLLGSGVFFGLLGLSASRSAFREIRIGGKNEKGYRIAVSGIVLCIFGIIANIISLPILFIL